MKWNAFVLLALAAACHADAANRAPIVLAPGADVKLDFGAAGVGGYPVFSVVTNDPAATLRISYACHPDGLGPKGDFWRETAARYLGPDIDLPILPANIDRYESYRLVSNGVYRASLLQGLVRYVRLRLEGATRPVVLASFAFDNDRVHSEGERAGGFDCSDRELAEIWEASVRTCELCAIPSYDSTWGPKRVRTLPYLADGAKRDRLVWSGDLWWAERSFFVGFNPSAPYMKGSVEMLAANHTPEGYVQASPWPDQAPPKAGEWGPFGSDEFAAWFVPVSWDAYFYTGDKALLKKVYPVVQGLMAYLARYQNPETGIFEQRKETSKHAAGLVFGATSLHHRAYMNILLWKTFADAASIAAELGERGDAERWGAAAELVSKSVRTSFWDGEKGCFRLSLEDGKFGFEANALALATRFATPDEARRIMPQLVRTGHGKFQALAARGKFEYGAADEAIAAIDAHGWRKMLKPDWKGMRLTSECMGLIRKGWGDEAHPDTAIAGLLTNYILGIEPAEPGFRAFSFRVPETTRIDWASGSVPTPHGEISSSWRKGENGELEVSVDVPQGTKCRLVPPKGEPVDLGPGAFSRKFAGCNGGFRVLVYGNSIAYHAPKAEIGWTNGWGMAASAPERDFAHLVAAGLERRHGGKAELRVRNIAQAERNFTTNVATMAELAADVGWKPDYVVIAVGDNAPKVDDSNRAAYRRFLADLARPFAGAKVVMRSPFWADAVKAECTANAAADVGAVYVDAGPIGLKKGNKATGLFAHKGVADHPGDRGMRELAELTLAGFDAARESPVENAEVRFCGKTLKVERCRVSAIPFNRVWPGCQRSMDQTALSAFVGFDVDAGGGRLEVAFAGEAPKGAWIRPFSRAQPVRVGNAWAVDVSGPEQFVMEFDGGGELHVFADPPWRGVEDGPNVLRFGPGDHYPGTIIPKSGDTIVVERGATVHGNFVLTGVDGVSIVGRGIVDGATIPRVDFGHPGSRHVAGIEGEMPNPLFVGRQREWGTAPVYAIRCRNVRIDGVTFRDAPRWTLNICQCEGVEVRNVKLVGMWRYNSDGIDICSSRDAVVADSFVRSFDDCVVARPPIGGMLVTNCVLWCDWGHNMKVQHAQFPATMENIVFSDIRALRVDSLLASVTTRYGSTNCVIRDVAFRNVEVDAPPSRPATCMQAKDAWRHSGRMSERLPLLDVFAYALGRPTPNQGAPVPVDEDSLSFLYDGIEMSDVKVYESPGRLVDATAPYSIECSVKTCAKNFIVRNARLSGLPKCTRLLKASPKGKIEMCD